MASSILTRAGLRTGLYTSPHLRDFRERIRVDGRMIPGKDLRELIEVARSESEEDLTYFEFATLLAFLYFARRRVDAAVFEAGMGGRLDATNLVTPAVSVITNVSLEHREFLGPDLRAIAREKAGVIKEGGICLTAAKQASVLGVLEETCRARKAQLFRLGKEIRIRRAGEGVFAYRGLGRHYRHLEIPLKGRHQAENAAMALGAVEVLASGGFAIADDAVGEGLRAVRWEGRLEVLSETPALVVDGAHNPAGIAALRRALAEDFPRRRLILIFGVLRDKDYRSMLRTIAPAADRLILTRPGSGNRAMPPEDIEVIARQYAGKVSVIGDPRSALAEAFRTAGPRDLICATGSLYLVGEVKKALNRIK